MYFKYNRISEKKNNSKPSISLVSYLQMWKDAYSSKKVILYHIENINVLKKLELKLKILVNMETDYKFFIFLLESLEDHSKTVSSVDKIFSRK
jgi:hypothetical protein